MQVNNWTERFHRIMKRSNIYLKKDVSRSESLMNKRINTKTRKVGEENGKISIGC